MAIQSPAREFALAEYTDRRNDIAARIQRIEEQIRNGLLASGGIWTWLLTNHNTPWFTTAIWIPALIVGYFTISWRLQHRAVIGIAKYIIELEKQFDLPTGIGWETNIAKYRQAWLQYTTDIFWITMLVLNIGGAILASMIQFPVQMVKP